MSLVAWNRDKRVGHGRSGTRYRIAPNAAPEKPGCRWMIEVEGDIFCSTDAAPEAVDQVERIEALRCVIAGLVGEMTAAELMQARSVALEMQDAAERSLSDHRLRAGDMEKIRQNILELRGLVRFIELRAEGSGAAAEPERVLH